MTSDRSDFGVNFFYSGSRYFRKLVVVSVSLMVDFSSESVSTCLAGGGGGGSTVSSLVSSSPLSIKTRCGSGEVSVTSIGRLLLVFAATGVLLSDIQAS